MRTSAFLLRSLAIVASAALVSCTSSTVTNSPADGVWDFKMTSPFGAISANVSMQAAGSQLSGTFDLGDGRIWPIQNGSIADNQLSFSLSRDGSPMIYEMSGVVDGGGVSGLAKAMGIEAPWEMTKKQ